MGTQVISVTNTNFAQRLDVTSKQVGVLEVKKNSSCYKYGKELIFLHTFYNSTCTIAHLLNFALETFSGILNKQRMSDFPPKKLFSIFEYLQKKRGEMDFSLLSIF